MTWFVRAAWLCMITGFVLTVYGIVGYVTFAGFLPALIGTGLLALAIAMLIAAQLVKNRMSSRRK